jgi:hypothetical protein
MMSVARGVLEKGMSIPGLACGPLVLPTFESNVLFILRFMVDCQVTGGNWVELPAGAWQNTKRPVSSCQARLPCAWPAACMQHRLTPAGTAAADRGGHHVQPAGMPPAGGAAQRHVQVPHPVGGH